MTVDLRRPSPRAIAHLESLHRALRGVRDGAGEVGAWGEHLARVLGRGGRLLAVGNGGSAAQAQHLTAELVGRYRTERAPLSALALPADTASVTALLNDYGADEVFARQVRAHGRADDVLVALSTSGRSANVVRAAAAAHECGLSVWALTGPGPNPLGDAADRVVAVEAPSTATVQEVHQVLVHVLCDAVDVALGATPS